MISIGKKSGVIWIVTNTYPKFSPGGCDSIEGDAFSSDVVFPYTRSFGIGTKRLQELVWVNGLFNSRVVYLNTNHWKSHTHTHTHPHRKGTLAKCLPLWGTPSSLHTAVSSWRGITWSSPTSSSPANRKGQFGPLPNTPSYSWPLPLADTGRGFGVRGVLLAEDDGLVLFLASSTEVDRFELDDSS